MRLNVLLVVTNKSDEQFIVIMGNPVDGFTHIGPFDSFEDGTDYMEEERGNPDMWLALLQKPSQAGDEP